MMHPPRHLALAAWGLSTALLYLAAACGGAPESATVEGRADAESSGAERTSGSESAHSAAESLELAPCQLSLPGRALRVPADCGSLDVAEDPSRPDGRRISLRVAVLRAVQREPEPDPLVLLAGGPGQAATEAFLPLLGSLAGIRRERDLVLVDQRGTGSSNALECDFGPEAELEALTDDQQETLLRECLRTWDADPRFYHTARAAADLDAVRQALGYAKVNLYGVSYGTRAALTYLRDFPDRVRSIVLDGVVPQDLSLGVDWARDAQRALDLIFERCRRDEACNQAFPRLGATFQSLLSSLEAEPATVRFRHPVSGEEISLKVDRELVAVLVQRLSYSPETVALLPLLLHEAGHDGPLDTVAAQALSISASTGGIAVGMGFSVLCAEDEPFYDDEEVAAASEGTYLLDHQPRLLHRMCAFWPREDLPVSAKRPTDSPVPALLLSGEADPVTPPAYGERVAGRLPNSLHLVAPGLGHNVLPRGCIPELVEKFVESGSADELDTSCVQDIEPSPFFLTPAGPAP